MRGCVGWISQGGRRGRTIACIAVRELANVRGTVEKARMAANEGWRSLNDITGSVQGRYSA